MWEEIGTDSLKKEKYSPCKRRAALLGETLRNETKKPPPMSSIFSSFYREYKVKKGYFL